MKQLFPFLIVLLFLSCQSKPKTNVVGHYHNKDRSFFSLAWLKFIKNTSTTVGNELVLSEDHRFTYATCSNVFQGRWEQEGDSLLLYNATNGRRQRHLSIPDYHANPPNHRTSIDTFIFAITPKTLVEKTYLKHKSKWLMVELEAMP